MVHCSNFVRLRTRPRVPGVRHFSAESRQPERVVLVVVVVVVVRLPGLSIGIDIHTYIALDGFGGRQEDRQTDTGRWQMGR